MSKTLYNRLALIGVGLIGSSIARAAKLQNAVGSIVATARSPETRRRIAELGLADQVVETNAEAVEGADLVIVCIPVGACGAVAAEIGPHLAPGATVSDVGSVKGSVVRDMRPHLPAHVHFVPAHPVAGTEYSGPDAGFAELFVNRWCILTPPDGTDAAATDKLTQFWTLLGANVSLSAVDYNGLVAADVDVFAFLDALATELHISAGTYADVLAAKADSGQISAALADVLDGTDRAAATVLAKGLGGNGTLPVGKLISLGAWAQKSIGSGLGATFAKVSALELLAASAALSDGTHQLALNLGAAVPGLVGIDTTLEIGEPPQGAGFYAFGPSGTLVRTAQVRLKFLATLGGGLALLNAGVRLPLSLEVASAEAGVESATCPGDGQTNGSARIWVKPGIARLLLGDAGSSQIVNVAGLLTVNATAPVELVSPDRRILTFTPAEIAAGTVKTVQTSGFVQGMVAGLIGGLSLDIRVQGLGLLPKAVLDAAIRTLLAPLAPVLDKTIDMLLATLGLKLGEADERVYAVTCGAPVLVR